MYQAKALFVPLILLAAQAACTSSTVRPVPLPDLRATIDSIINTPPLHRTSWGILAMDADTRRVIYELNGEKHYIPASNTKLVIGVSALGMFGPEHRYRTPLMLGGRSADTAAVLVVVGSGDPTWSERFHDSAVTPLDSMAAIVSASGVRHVDALVIDASRFTDELVNGTWEVGDLPGVYAPPVDAVAAADGTFTFEVRGGVNAGDTASAVVIGPMHQPIRASMTTDTVGARTSVDIDYTQRHDTIYITGSVGAGVVDTVTRAVTQPARSVGLALADRIRARGISVDSVAIVRDSSSAAMLRSHGVVIGEWVSPPMRDIVAVILRPSQNWVAEQVLKSLGAEFGEGGSWRDGIDTETAYLYDVAGVDSGAVSLRDGSGMSAQNLLSPSSIITMLLHARAQAWSDSFRDALASPGLDGSTLSNRLLPLEGRVFGKTGTISNVNSLSGYLVTRAGRDIVFSIMSNGSGLPSGIVRAAIDDIVLAIARDADGLDATAYTDRGGWE